ncbi:hypothetical protein [Paraburkholderia flagellata]|uniref:hypothetical protein n=1 Tax=Paraburkholderia flagellata TaxID=2883241 RepID=UPI001F421171|nr:hypothetical protein [Paraburkholderia flagellata]
MRTLEDIEKNSVDLKASRLAATIERDKFERRLNERPRKTLNFDAHAERFHQSVHRPVESTE